MMMRLKLQLPTSVDAWLWRNFRPYRRHEMRKRVHIDMVGVIVESRCCELCRSTEHLMALRNGGVMCVECRETLGGEDIWSI
jgi:hypothetical protein